MSVQDIRQGRQINAPHIVRELRRFSIMGMANTEVNKETIRQAAVLLEQAMARGLTAQAVMDAREAPDDEDERITSGLLEE